MNFRINLKIVSVVLGIILWLYVNVVISPVIRRTIKTPIDFKNAPPNMKIIPQKTDVEIVLNGTRRDFIFAGKESIQASIDLYNLQPRPTFFPLKVTTPSGLSVVAMKPAQVEVNGELLVKRKFELTVDIKGQAAEGFLAESPVASPGEVIVEGPKALVEKISGCQVSVFMADARNSISESRKISVYGQEGEIEKDIRVIPEKAMVLITIKASFPSRAVPIIPQFINKTPDGLKLESYQVSPPEITISGPQRVLDQLPNIRTSAIDLSLINASSTIIALLDPPPYENVKIGGSNTVSLKVNLSPTPITKTVSGLPLTLKNSPNQHCSVSPASYSLLLKGLPEDLKRISPAELAIILETKAMDPGTYTVDLPCPTGLPPKIEILEIQPAKVVVQVSPMIQDSGASQSSGQ